MSKKDTTKQEDKKEGTLSGFVLPAYQLSFFRRVLGMEKLGVEDGKVRNHFVFDFLVPLLNKIDVQVAEIRDKYAVRRNDGGIQTTDKGEIDYGDNAKVSFDEFNTLMETEVFVAIENMDIFKHILGLFESTTYKMDENETVLYQQIVEALKAVKIA